MADEGNVFRRITILVPALLVGICVLLIHNRNPYYYATNYDPDYIYLTNSAMLLHFYEPQHIHHPGTTVQLAGALFVGLKYGVDRLGGESGPLRSAIMKSPESYLSWINGWILALVIASFLWSGQRMMRISGTKIAVFFQLACLLIPTLIITLVRVIPEPFLAAIALLLISVMHAEFHSGNPGENTMRPVAAGILLGAGIVTKITFAPMFFLVFIMSGVRRKGIAIITALITFLCLTFPIARLYPKFIQWVVNFITHTGAYGDGQPGIFRFEQARINSWSLFQSEPFFLGTIILIFACAFVYMVRDGSNRKLAKTLTVIAIAALVNLILAIKNPQSRYLLISMILSAWAVTLLVEYWSNFGQKFLRVAFPVLFLSAGFLHSYDELSKWIEGNRLHKQDVQALAKTVSLHPECKVIPYYRSSAPDYALAFGNDFSGNFFRADLLRIFPDAVFYNIWGQSFYGFDPKVNNDFIREKLKDGRCFWLQGKPLPEGSHYALGLDLSPIEQRTEVIYRLNWIKRRE